MKVLYIHQYFKTPEEGGAIRSFYLAEALVKKGMQVEVITSHNGESYDIKNINGVIVHYLPVAYDNSFGILKRMYSFLKFFFKSYSLGKKIDADICYATSTPLSIGLTALLLKWKKGIPYFFEVRDLWPEVIFQMGYFNNFLMKKILYGLEAKIYKGADKIIALSPGIKSAIENKVSGKEVILIPNMADCDFFEWQKKNPLLEEKFGVKNLFVVSYFGALGKANNIDSFIEIIRYCKRKELNQIRFLIAGGGAQEESLKIKIKNEGLDNVSFLGFVNKTEIAYLLNVTDASYVSFATVPVLETSSPNKFFDSIAAGKLCIVNTRGWIKEIIEEHQCGFYADPLKPEEFVAKILPYINESKLLSKAQSQSRKLAEDVFSRKIQTDKFVKLFQKK